MTIHKNPDWMAWLPDAFYWLRTPPRIYFVVIVGLAIALMYANRSPQLVYTPPTPAPRPYLAPAQPAPVPPALPTPAVATPSDAFASQCPSGMGFVFHLNRCIPMHRRAVPIYLPGTKDHCPLDAIYVNRLAFCTPLYDNGTYSLELAEEFFLSGNRMAHLYLRSGYLTIFASSDFSPLTYSAPHEFTLWPGVSVALTAASPSVRIRLEFERQ
jgi:hypothetical protein